MQKRKILIVDDDPRERSGLCKALEGWGYYVTTAHDGIDASKKIRTEHHALVISNFNIPGESGLDLLNTVKSENEDIEVLFIANQPSITDAVESVKAGALDYVVKPLDHTQIKLIIEKAFDDEGNGNYFRSPKQSVTVVAKDKEILRLLDLAKQVATSTASVLIQGESGTGKELFARFIHENSKRQNGPFVAINCAALPESLLESELFGHEKGAFTGAISKKPGKFELANGGTILLDEITEMQLHLQSKLLRVLQEREIDRVGGLRPIKADIRVIATTNRNIKSLIEKSEFRNDLYYRLSVIPLIIPPLRNRLEEIGLLAQHFIEKYNEIDGYHVKCLTESALEVLKSHPFNGNVRELENIIHRAVLLCDGEMIREKDIYIEESSTESGKDSPETRNLPETFMSGPLKDVEKKLIFHTLDKTKGNRTHAAKILGISVRTLRNKLNEYKENMTEV